MYQALVPRTYKLKRDLTTQCTSSSTNMLAKLIPKNAATRANSGDSPVVITPQSTETNSGRGLWTALPEITIRINGTTIDQPAYSPFSVRSVKCFCISTPRLVLLGANLLTSPSITELLWFSGDRSVAPRSSPYHAAIIANQYSPTIAITTSTAKAQTTKTRSPVHRRILSRLLSDSACVLSTGSRSYPSGKVISFR